MTREADVHSTGRRWGGRQADPVALVGPRRAASRPVEPSGGRGPPHSVHAAALARGRDYTCGVSPVLVHLGLAAVVPAMVCALLLGVIPNLARESPESRPLHAWIDLWLPLLLALPLSAAALGPNSYELSPALLLVLLVGGPVAVAAVVSGAALLNERRTPASRVLDGSHIIACAVLAPVLLGAAYVARLPDWIGHLFLTAAILWLWTVSGDARTPGEGEARRSAFFVDWAGPLTHPVAARWKAIMAIALLVGGACLVLGHLQPASAASAAGEARVPPLLLPAIVALSALAGQGAALAAVWGRVGPRAGIRASVSTMLLSTLLSIGLLCTRLVPWGELIRSRGRLSDVYYQPLDLTGLAAVGPAGLVVAALALTAIVPRLGPAGRRLAGWSLIGAAVGSLLAGILLTRSAWPALAPRPPEAAPASEEPIGRGPGGRHEQFCIGA